MKVEYQPAIEAELVAIRSYYENQSPGLGRQFVDEFERQVLVLASACLSGAVSLGLARSSRHYTGRRCILEA